jgi:DNA-binding transcriptional LysR family regulator
MAFTLQQLKVLVTVTELQSVSQAAQRLRLQQSTVSFHLQSLEAAVGVALVIRSRQRWELTAAGKEMVRYARMMLSTVEETERVMADFQSARQRRLLVGTSTVPATFIVPSAVQGFHTAFPHIQLEIEAIPSPLVRRRVEARQLDLGFIIDDQPVNPSLESHLVMEDEIGCVYSPNTGLQWIKGAIDAHQLGAIPLIGHAVESSTAQAVQDWAKKQSVRLESTVILGSIDMIKTAVKQGMGASLLSKLMVYDEIRAGTLLYAPLVNPPRRQLRVIYQKELQHSQLQNFLDIVIQVASKLSFEQN